MGSIRDLASGRLQILQPEHRVGRHRACALYLPHTYVSGQHAAIRWNGNHWEVRDLASRNGTFLDGSSLKPGEEYPLTTGSRLWFGKVSVEPWVVADESAPPVMAVPVGGGEPVLIDGNLLALPSSDDPVVTIYRGAEGAWVVEQSDAALSPITNLQTLEVAGHAWRFCCAESLRTTSVNSVPIEIDVRSLELVFSVSSDAGSIALQMKGAGRSFDVGSRSHNTLLLALARRRLEDAAEGLPDTTCGWIYQDELASPQLNIDVFRVRKQFAGLGVVDAAHVIERRPRTGQLRIGTSRLSIEERTKG